jgi:putative hemolysin
MEIEIGLTSLILITLTFFSTIDIAFGQLSDLSLRRIAAEAEDRPTLATTFLSELLESRPRFRFVLSTANQILLVATAVLVTYITNHLIPERRPILVAFFIGVILVVIFRQLIPRLVSYSNPERTLLTLLPLFKPVYRTLAFVPIKQRRNKEHQVETGVGAEEEEEANGDDIQALIEVGAEEGILEEEEGELIQSIIEFGDTTVNEVMTPRTEIVSLPINATVREARDVIIESKYSRLPVYRDQIDNIEGIIYVRDLLQYWPTHREDDKIAPLLRPAYFVPETKPVSDLLEEMQKSHVQLAMVIDEYGGVAGLVTVEDILEEIVGEIEDEDIEGDEVVEIVEASNGYYEVLGSTEIGKIERLFDLEIEDDDFTTIAGLVISESGCVPKAGTQLTFRGLHVEVLEADERRIGRLRLRRAEEEKSNSMQSKVQEKNVNK